MEQNITEQMVNSTYEDIVETIDEVLVIDRPVSYNKFNQYICDRNEVPIIEILVENDQLGNSISDFINNNKD